MRLPWCWGLLVLVVAVCAADDPGVRSPSGYLIYAGTFQDDECRVLRSSGHYSNHDALQPVTNHGVRSPQFLGAVRCGASVFLRLYEQEDGQGPFIDLGSSQSSEDVPFSNRLYRSFEVYDRQKLARRESTEAELSQKVLAGVISNVHGVIDQVRKRFHESDESRNCYNRTQWTGETEYRLQGAYHVEQDNWRIRNYDVYVGCDETGRAFACETEPHTGNYGRIQGACKKAPGPLNQDDRRTLAYLRPHIGAGSSGIGLLQCRQAPSGQWNIFVCAGPRSL